jgi:predicted metal-binding membrane protein
MSNYSNSVTKNNIFLLLVEGINSFLIKRPHWRAWFFSFCAWCFLVKNYLANTTQVVHSDYVIYCSTNGNVRLVGHSLDKINNNGSFSYIFDATFRGLVPWIIMVVAMMFLLLNEPIKHVAFSIRRKNRDIGILGFLIGYIILWTVTGLLYLLIPPLLNEAVRSQIPFVNGLIKASGFLLASILIWLPDRPIKMVKCAQTIPISIHGLKMFSDCICYGLKMGAACLNMCWAPMIALMLAHHTLSLMYIVTIILVFERYFLSHTNKLLGYVWGILALIVFSVEMWHPL